MSKQTPAERASEQDYEIRRWLREIANDALHAHVNADYATITYLHKALARLMGNYQRFRKEQAALRAEVIQHMIDETKKEEEHRVVETD